MKTDPFIYRHVVARPEFIASRLAWAQDRRVDLQAALAVVQSGSPPRRADWIFAVAFGLLGTLEGLTEIADHPSGWAEVAFSLCAAAGVPWRRVSRPFMLVIALTGFTAGEAMTRDPEFGITGGAFLALLFLVYGLVRWRPERDIVIALPSVLIIGPLGAWFRSELAAEAVASFLLWMLVAAAALLMRYRFVLNQNREEQVRLTERNVLARELHDSVAHYVSAIAVQAQAAQFVAGDNPEAALHAMAEVESTANRAIDEMRRMVDVLRTSDDIARTVASTSLLDLADNNSQPPVRVVGDVDLSALSPSVAAAAFRVAQESVTNARKHGPYATFINVACTITPDEVVLQIANDGVTGRPSRGGYGLIGMEERLLAVNGHLNAGPAPHGGWSVVARIPREGSTSR